MDDFDVIPRGDGDEGGAKPTTGGDILKFLGVVLLILWGIDILKQLLAR